MPATDPRVDACIQKALIVTTEAGLANRLRVLLSGMALAEATDRTFGMRWRATPACSCVFDRLFQNTWNVRDDIDVDGRRALDLSRTPWNGYPDWHALEAPTVYVYAFGWLIQPARLADHVALDTRCQELMSELLPAPPLRTRIAEFKRRFFRDRMIGVHLRRGDFKRLRPDTTANVEDATRQIDAWLDETRDAGILLCTDDGAGDPYSGRSVPGENLVERFTRRYGTRMVTTDPSSLDRRTSEAIEDAVVDLWLLRETDRFVGTKGSSFSELAAFGRSIPTLQSAGSTSGHERLQRWLKGSGVDALRARLGHYEFGKDLPLTILLVRYRRRLRGLLLGRI